MGSVRRVVREPRQAQIAHLGSAGHRHSDATPPAASVMPAGRRLVPAATAGRLPVYHRVLTELLDRGVESVSSQELAELSGSNPAKLRKDLSHLGSFGTRGVGYSVEYLHFHISRELGIARELPVVIVGAGNLGQALAGYTAAMGRGVVVLGVFDADRSVVGSTVAGHTVKALSSLPRALKGKDGVVGVIATPAEAAQAVADRLVACGVSGLLNFASGVLTVPADVEVRSIDVGLELRVLAFHSHHRSSNNAVSRHGDAEAVDAEAVPAATHEEIA